MKKSIILVALATLALAMTSCQKEENNPINPSNNNTENPNNNSTRVKSASDLIGTNWTFGMDNWVFVTETNDTILIPVGDIVYLTFDSTYAHFTFSDLVEAYSLSADGFSFEQIAGVDYSYDYTMATHTGYLNGTAEDDNGNIVPAQFDFTYDDNADEITFTLNIAYEGDTATTQVPVVFHRSE